MKINCIIVDDEPVAQDLLKKYVSDVPALRLLQVCSNAFEATEALMQHEVHLIFLDINMPRLSGMQFYKSLSNPPAVIFTTAYSEYALEGFEVDAADYLLKPFSFERFYHAVNRILDKLKNSRPEKEEGHILLKADKKIHRVKLSDILYLEGLGDYVKVHFSGSFLVVHDTIKDLLELLPGTFLRVHKSFVVSLGSINYIEGNMTKVGERDIPIGQKYKEEFLVALKSSSTDKE
jgi:DNA-binding LytR/AlgR family response regulator